MIATEFLSCKFSEIVNAMEYFITKKKIKSFFPINNVKGDLKQYLHHLDLKELYALVEYPYVDKVYRDSYYNYYSTKNRQYDRNCIRISLFKYKLSDNLYLYQDEKLVSELKKKGNDIFKGFVIVRPTYPRTIGRSIISPSVLRKKDLYCCCIEADVMVNGLKMSIEGFPHCSQDDETIKCAETTLWCITEYFSLKYPEYKSVLPFNITTALEKFTYERQVPSHGLSPKQISYALREFGFGVKMYSKSAYGDDEFARILYYYVESGIPVISIIQNYLDRTKQVAHGTVYIGHGKISSSEIKILKQFTDEKGNNIELQIGRRKIPLFDSADIEKKYVVIDDNCPPYQFSSPKLNNDSCPTDYYNDYTTSDQWKKCEITNIVVPLHPKVYLESLEARKFIITLIPKVIEKLRKKHKIQPINELLIRLLLTSSRSFKDKIVLNPTITSDIKDLIIETSMPKFIWLIELSNKELYQKEEGKALGQIVIDATEASRNYLDSLIYFIWENYFITWKNDNFRYYPIKYSDFDIYKNNLKQFKTI